MRISGGTHFGENFRTEDVELKFWGEAGFLFDDCNNARMRYDSVDLRFNEGTLVPVKLLGLAMTSCEEPPPVAPLNAGSWRLSSDMGRSMTEMYSASVDGRVFTGGGYGGFTYYDRWDPDSGSHTELAPSPEPRHHIMMASDGTDIYVAGGYQSRLENENPSNTFWRYDPVANSWEVLPNMPRVRAAGAALHLMGRIWIAGGTGIGNELLAWNLRTESWEMYPGTAGLLVDSMQAVPFENEIWWMGGRTNITTNAVWIWNPVSLEWRQGPPMIKERAGHAAKVVQGQIMVSSGEVIDVMPGSLVEALEIFAPGATEWVQGPSAPVPVHGTSGAESNGSFVIVAGSDVAGANGDNRATQVYDPN